MRLVIILSLLFTVVNSCEEFWKKWESFSCASSKRCYKSKNQTSVEILNKALTIKCNGQAVDLRLLQCLDVNQLRNLEFNDCQMSDFNVGGFASSHAVNKVVINYEMEPDSFESASFTNMSSLKSVVIFGISTTKMLNLTFENVPSLTSLEIRKYNLSTYMWKLYRGDGEELKLSQDIFSKLYNLQKLKLWYSFVESIPLSQFRNLTRLKYLNLERNRISALPVDLLQSFPNLKVFSINSNRITQIPSGFLKGLQNLNNFSAIACSLFALEEDLFSDAIHLKYVDLGVNKIQYLPPQIFKNNKNLEEFRFGFNKIATISAEIFSDLPKLKVINLVGNLLLNLPEDIFANLTSLEELILSGNRITFLPENIFVPLKELRTIELSGNEITNFSDKWLFDANKRLEYVDLSETGMKKWPSINWTEHNLDIVDFRLNDFGTVKLPIHTPNPTKFDLSNCKIKTIYIDDWKYGNHSPTYYLGGESIICNEDLQQLLYTFNSSLESTLRIFPDMRYMRCYGEDEMVLDYLRPLYTINTHCPVNCECFQEGKDVKVNCAGRRLNKVPEKIIENATIVDLSNNNIKEFSNTDYFTWRKVTQLHLSNNSMNEMEDSIVPSLTYLLLDGNQLQELPELLMNQIDASWEFQIFLSGNNWKCGCQSRFTKEWIFRNREKIVDFDDVLCQDGSSSFSFAEILSSDDCEQVPSSNSDLPPDLSFSW